MVALGIVGSAEVAVRQRVQDDIPAGRGERESTLLRQMREGTERLLEVPHGLAMD